MSHRSTAPLIATAAVAAVIVALPVKAENAGPPTSYSVTQVSSMFVPGLTMKIYRDGQKALIDQSYPPRAGAPKGFHMRMFADLQKGTTYTWDLIDTSVPCGQSPLSGDWGDPFLLSTGLMADLAQQHPQETGRETISGIATKVMQTSGQGTTPATKIWLEPDHGLIIKAESIAAKGEPQVLIDVKELSFAAPPASVFALPAACANAAVVPTRQTEAQRFAGETGDDGADFVNANVGPGAAGACKVQLRIVQAGTMQDITSGFQLAIDKHVDPQRPATYNIGVENGHATFKGGALHEVTAQFHEGKLNVDDLPAQFDVEVSFGSKGDGSALIYRQCFTPRTVLLYVVKNPEKLSDGGDWLWVKSGKFAAAK